MESNRKFICAWWRTGTYTSFGRGERRFVSYALKFIRVAQCKKPCSSKVNYFNNMCSYRSYYIKIHLYSGLLRLITRSSFTMGKWTYNSGTSNLSVCVFIYETSQRITMKCCFGELQQNLRIELNFDPYHSSIIRTWPETQIYLTNRPTENENGRLHNTAHTMFNC
jgi:hypothetical protein